MVWVLFLVSPLFMGALHWVSKWVDVQARVGWDGLAELEASVAKWKFLKLVLHLSLRVSEVLCVPSTSHSHYYIQ